MFLTALVATAGCSTSTEQGEDAASDFDLAHADVNVELVSGFTSLHRDQVNHLGERDEEISEWSLHYVVTPDGFEGVVAFGTQTDGTVRYLTALDSKTRATLLIDGVAATRSAEAQQAKQSGAEADFVANTFDDVTVQWLRSELYRIIGALQDDVDAHEAGGIAPRAFTPAQICAARLAIYAASFVIPFTKVPLIGRGASLTAQFVGSFLIDAAGDAVIGQMTEAAKSSTAAAASGAALSSVLKRMSTPIRSLGGSGVGLAAGFVVGAVLGTEGDLQLLPGDRVVKQGEGTIIVHKDGTRTTIAAGGAYRLLPTVCRQALGKTTRAAGGG